MNQNEIEQINIELQELGENRPQQYEQLESMKFEENKVTELEIDFSKKIEKWNDVKNNTIKKIIPVTHNGIRKNWWLNVRNPIYRELLEAAAKGMRLFYIMKTGKDKDTKYILVR